MINRARTKTSTMSTRLIHRHALLGTSDTAFDGTQLRILLAHWFFYSDGV